MICQGNVKDTRAPIRSRAAIAAGLQMQSDCNNVFRKKHFRLRPGGGCSGGESHQTRYQYGGKPRGINEYERKVADSADVSVVV